MRVTVNGQTKDIREATLKDLIERFARHPQRVIAELNGEIIDREQWENTVLKDGDRLELVGFVGGG